MRSISIFGRRTLSRPNVPLRRADDAPAFSEQWQARAFVLACHLHEAGHFTWSEWADALAAAIAQQSTEPSADGGDVYYRCWLGALEQLIVQKNLSHTAELIACKNKLHSAYLSTPHGQPVSL